MSGLQVSQEQAWECYQWTEEQERDITANGGLPVNICSESGTGFVYTGGVNGDYPGCQTCDCCQPISFPPTSLPTLPSLPEPPPLPSPELFTRTLSCGDSPQGPCMLIAPGLDLHYKNAVPISGVCGGHELLYGQAYGVVFPVSGSVRVIIVLIVLGCSTHVPSILTPEVQ